MFAIILSAFIPRMTMADEVCFYLGIEGNSPSHNVDTDCEVCVYQDRYDKWGHRVQKCEQEVTKQRHCFEFGSGDLRENLDVFVRMSAQCTDALWINRFQVAGDHGRFDYTRGSKDKNGWCLSGDRNDHLEWSDKSSNNAYVPAGQCFHTLTFATSGEVWGWHSEQERYCRHRKAMRGCKQECETGWREYATFSPGCCASLGSCFGHRKRCQIDLPCHRPPYTFLFNGCPRGEGASSWGYKGHYNIHECHNLCDSDPTCTAFEINGCKANPTQCGGACWLFWGTKGGAIHNGGCVTNGDMRAYQRQFGSRRRVEDLDAEDQVPESWTEEDGVTVEVLPMSEEGGSWVELAPADVIDDSALLERLQKREADAVTEDDVEGATTEDVVEGPTTEDVVEGLTTEDVVEETDTRRRL